jgi:hypothetical protein
MTSRRYLSDRPTSLHGTEFFLRSRLLFRYSRISNFMKFCGSLQSLQEPSPGPSPESNQCNPYDSTLILSSLLVCLPSGLSFWLSSTILYAFCVFPPCSLHALSISSSSTRLFKSSLTKSRHYAVLSCLPITSTLFGPNTPLGILFSAFLSPVDVTLFQLRKVNAGKNHMFGINAD